MMLSQLPSTLIFALLLTMPVAANKSGNIDGIPLRAPEADVQRETIAADLTGKGGAPVNGGTGSNSRVLEKRIDTPEATNKQLNSQLNQIEIGSRKDVVSSFWLPLAMFGSSLLALVLVVFSHLRLSSRLNQINQKLALVGGRLAEHRSEMALLHDRQLAPSLPVSSFGSSKPSQSFDDNVPKRDVFADPHVDTSIALPQPLVSRLAHTEEELRSTIAAMIADPGMRVSSYDRELTKFGTVCGLKLGADGQSAQLVSAGSDASRRLIVVLLNNQEDVIILPSGRFVKDFTMTFKHILDAGNDTKTVFSCHTDGSGILRVGRLATGQVDGPNIRNLQKGDLSGFVG